MTPYQIDVLLYYHARPLKTYAGYMYPAYPEAISLLLREGLIHSTGSTMQGVLFQTTPVGEVHVRSLCDLPTPTMEITDGLGRRCSAKGVEMLSPDVGRDRRV